MGVKGNKATTKGAEFVNVLRPRLETLGDITTKGMFGGHGIFQAGKMFALVTSDAELFLKVDESNLEQFTKAESPRYGKMPYYQLPAKVLKSDKELIDWAAGSVDVAHG